MRLRSGRADHLPAYAYARPILPSLERLAARGVRFERRRSLGYVH